MCTTPAELATLYTKTSIKAMANVVSLASLRKKNQDDEEEKNTNEYYVGGASSGGGSASGGGRGGGGGGGSGLAVLAPPDPDAISKIISRAAKRETNANDEEKVGEPTHVITFYRDGFTVNDGPYRSRTDPANAPFLESIEKGVVPRELESADRQGHVDIQLVDKRSEDYTPPSPPRYTAFSGQGQTMGASSFSTNVVVQAATSQVTPSQRPVVDDKKPTTTLQIRLHNGTRLRETLNLHHTIGDLHAIIQLNGAGGQAYALLAGFPPRPIPVDMKLTIDAAQLKGASITQKLV